MPDVIGNYISLHACINPSINNIPPSQCLQWHIFAGAKIFIQPCRIQPQHNSTAATNQNQPTHSHTTMPFMQIHTIVCFVN